MLILTVYLMIEKTSPGMFDGQAEIAVEIEASVKSYISLKAVISVVTGVLVRAPGSHSACGTDSWLGFMLRLAALTSSHSS